MIRLDLVGVRDLKDRLGMFAVELSDFSELWDAISDVMEEHTAETWATDGFGTWPQLAPSTVKKKARLGLPPELMIETGNLLDSLTDPEAAAGIGQGRSSLGTFTEKTFSWGTDVEYAGYHHEGPNHNPALPVRNVIIVTPVLELKFQQASEDFVDEKLREAGLD